MWFPWWWPPICLYRVDATANEWSGEHSVLLWRPGCAIVHRELSQYGKLQPTGTASSNILIFIIISRNAAESPLITWRYTRQHTVSLQQVCCGGLFLNHSQSWPQTKGEALAYSRVVYWYRLHIMYSLMLYSFPLRSSLNLLSTSYCTSIRLLLISCFCGWYHAPIALVMRCRPTSFPRLLVRLSCLLTSS